MRKEVKRTRCARKTCLIHRHFRLGQRDSAAILYERCAPQFQQFDRGISIDFYLKAARLCEQDEKVHQAADLYEKAAMQMIRTGNFAKTSELLEKVTNLLVKIDNYDRLNRVVLYRILLKLFNEDSVAGRNIFDQACRDYPSFDQWEERDHIDLLLEAFDQEDKDLISQRCQVGSVELHFHVEIDLSVLETVFYGD